MRWLFLKTGDTLIPIGFRDKEPRFHTTLFTGQFVPYISPRGYYRMGFLAGFGKARYTYTDFTEGFYDAKAYTTGGSAALAQGYWDWGGDSWGGRLGMDYLSTDLEPLNVEGERRRADATGTYIFLDLRWEFH